MSQFIAKLDAASTDIQDHLATTDAFLGFVEWAIDNNMIGDLPYFLEKPYKWSEEFHQFMTTVYLKGE